MRERNFTYAVARIRSLETRLLDNTQLDRIANAANLSEALSFLGETEYSGGLASITEPSQFEEALTSELDRVIRLLLKLTEEAPEFVVFLHRFDIENIKKLLKQDDILAAKLSRLGFWTPEWLREIIASGNLAEFPSLFTEAIIEARRLYHETGDVQEIDRILDRAWFELGFSRLKEGISELLFRWWIALIDLTNFRTFVRMRLIGLIFSEYQRFYIHNGSLALDQFQDLWEQPDEKILAWLGNTPYYTLINDNPDLLLSLTVLERGFDNYLTRLITQAKYISMGIEPLVGYFIAKEIEIRTLRIILVGKANEVSNQKIKERLRRAYA